MWWINKPVNAKGGQLSSEARGRVGQLLPQGRLEELPLLGP